MDINLQSVVISALLAFPAYGIVESVREVPLVRLDDGRAIEVVHTGMPIEAGQRVHVVPDPNGARIEPADDPMFLQP